MSSSTFPPSPQQTAQRAAAAGFGAPDTVAVVGQTRAVNRPQQVIGLATGPRALPLPDPQAQAVQAAFLGAIL